MRLILAMMVLGLDAWALVRLYGTPRSRTRKAAWSALVVVLPVAGALAAYSKTRANRGRP